MQSLKLYDKNIERLTNFLVTHPPLDFRGDFPAAAIPEMSISQVFFSMEK
jgi:hypothetical protein